VISSPAVIFEEEFSIPAGVSDLELFRHWTWDEAFPERGRIDYLAGTVEVDLSPEDLYTYGVVKTAITARLYPLIVDTDRGCLFPTAHASSRHRLGCPSSRTSSPPSGRLCDRAVSARSRARRCRKDGSSSSKGLRTSSSRSSAIRPSGRTGSDSPSSTPRRRPRALAGGLPRRRPVF
jgi:hypothetical protein